jgi:hypothetical protein
MWEHEPLLEFARAFALPVTPMCLLENWQRFEAGLRPGFAQVLAAKSVPLITLGFPLAFVEVSVGYLRKGSRERLH